MIQYQIVIRDRIVIRLLTNSDSNNNSRSNSNWHQSIDPGNEGHI